MVSKNFKIFLFLLISILFFSSSHGEEKIDIWKNKKNDSNNTDDKLDKSKNPKKNSLNSLEKISVSQKITEDKILDSSEDVKVFGVYDPSDYDFNLNMWSSTSAEDVRSSIKRLKKIKLSRTSSEILENILLSFSYPPDGMNNKEFVDLKINWLIDNNKSELVEDFLKQNEEFDGKSKAVQYLVDQNIAQANIKEGCEKIKFIDSKIKDPYLEKFKIYCFVFNDQNHKHNFC